MLTRQRQLGATLPPAPPSAAGRLRLIRARRAIDHLYPHTPIIIAHRGASAYAPENTLAAFTLAADMGADAIELDAKLSADGRVVVIHDSSVDRTTDGAGRVAALTLAQLRELDAGSKFDARYAGERIPTLEQVFESVGRRLFVNVELTNYAAPRDALAGKVVEIIRHMGMQRRVLLSSFNPLALLAAQRADPELPIATLYRRSAESFMRRLFVIPFVPHDARHPEKGLVDARAMRWFKAHGFRVNVWTASTPEDAARLIALGVDGVITGAPDLLK